MNKSQFYLSECADAASKSTMYYTLGSVIVLISRGYNHQRPKYDCQTTAAAGPMASIFNATRGQAPARKQQVQLGVHTAATTTTRKPDSAAAGPKPQVPKQLPQEQLQRCAGGGGAPQGFRFSSEVGLQGLQGEEAAGSRVRPCL
ncbi:hypothetical protein C8R46DRAFT_1106439 [Mycena filopes]|nr:hypothetical protein C8R46DRAFT_1106439 [Mycena filopes]